MGVTSIGLNIYEKDNKIQPKMTFSWSEIRRIHYEGKKFVIGMVDKKSSNFIFFSKRKRINKLVSDLILKCEQLLFAVSVDHLEKLNYNESN